MQPEVRKPSGKAARPYHSARRAQSAADTRTTILATAMRLFLEHGYGKVTVADIARDASLAVPTVYASVGGKSAVLATLIEDAMGDPVVGETLAAIRKCGSPHDVIGVTAHGVRVDNERYHDIVVVMTTAAAIDDAAAEILIRSDDGYRQALAHAARRVQNLNALKPGLSVKRATDILWFYLGREAWHLLVSERRWSWDDAERWLSEQVCAALIDPR